MVEGIVLVEAAKTSKAVWFKRFAVALISLQI